LSRGGLHRWDAERRLPNTVVGFTRRTRHATADRRRCYRIPRLEPERVRMHYALMTDSAGES
jgi:hypothetical protein